MRFFIFLKSNPRFSCFSFTTRKNNWIMKWESIFMVDELRRMQKYLNTWNSNHDFRNCFPICRVDESPLWVEPNFDKKEQTCHRTLFHFTMKIHRTTYYSKFIGCVILFYLIQVFFFCQISTINVKNWWNNTIWKRFSEITHFHVVALQKHDIY